MPLVDFTVVQLWVITLVFVGEADNFVSLDIKWFLLPVSPHLKRVQLKEQSDLQRNSRVLILTTVVDILNNNKF